MRTLCILLLVGVAACLAAADDGDHSSLGHKLMERMGFTEEQIHKIGEKKKKLQNMVKKHVEKVQKKLESLGLGGLDEGEPTEEDPKLPHVPSIDDPHVEEENVVDGDEMMTEKQIDEKINDEEELEKHERKKRQFQTDPRKYWPTTIDYYVDPSLDSTIVPMVHEGMQWINDNTCFTMNLKRSKSQARGPFITFSSGSWCQSYVGKITNGEQVVQMITKCATVGTIIHEFLHALGFYHEQSRSDRDQYVSINMHNVQSNARGNFETSRTDNFEWPYVYGSVMAYPGLAFSKDGRSPTIVAEDEKYQRSMGFRVTGTFADSRRINTAYKCIDKCTSGPTCQNGGYRNPKKCHQCMCPEAFVGTDCSQLRPAVDPSRSNSGCGGVVNVPAGGERKYQLKVATNGNKSPHYCTTEFKAPAGKVLKIRWAAERGDWMPCVGGCSYGFIELNPGVKAAVGRDYGLPGFRDCCHSQVDTSPVTTDSNMVIGTAFAREHSASLTVYLEAVNGNGGGGGGGSRPTPSPTRRPSPPATPRPTTRAPRPRPRPPTGGGGTITVDRATYNRYVQCSNDCQRSYQRYGYNWYARCRSSCYQALVRAAAK